MSILTGIFGTQDETPDLAAVQVSPRDVAAAAAVSGWLSDPDFRWLPLACPAPGA